LVTIHIKRGGRTLDHGTLEEVRNMAVERVREGERPSVVIASYGFHRCVIYRCLKVADERGKGVWALASSRGTECPKKLSAAQEGQIFRWVNGKSPVQYGFDFGLWTRQIVGELVKQKFGVALSLASIGAILARSLPLSRDHVS
jgi:transposase